VLTSNRLVQDWGRHLNDNTMAGPILGRLRHHAHLFEFEGKSYRLKEAATRMATQS
jgi:DNA replication protein DnaC